MQRARHRIRGWLGLAGAIGALILVPTLSGCPGTLDPDVAKLAGTTGAGGTMASDCTGANDGATIVTTTCATQYCHSAQGASGVGGVAVLGGASRRDDGGAVVCARAVRRHRPTGARRPRQLGDVGIEGAGTSRQRRNQDQRPDGARQPQPTPDAMACSLHRVSFLWEART